MLNLPLTQEIYNKIPNDFITELDHKTIFITGGTGFIGKWLLDLFVWIKTAYQLKINLLVLTRNPKDFNKKFPELSKHIEFIKSDINETFKLPTCEVDYFIHGATSTDTKAIKKDPISCFHTIIDGTKNTLELARKLKIKRYLMISSGAVYGQQHMKTLHQAEENSCYININNSDSVYPEAKRAAELLTSLYHEQYGLHTTIARCYAFVGPFLPLNQHFAVGNFIYDLLYGSQILIKGDGTTLRSYMYAADLVYWLLALLLRGRANQAYNVGSDEKVSILELAKLVKKCGVEIFSDLKLSPRNLKIEVLGKSKQIPPERYVPSIELAKKELNLKLLTPLSMAIKETIKWHRLTNANV